MTSVHDYIAVLNEEVDRRFPNTRRCLVAGGDSIRDAAVELREGPHRLRYSPYVLFANSNGAYEDSILELCTEWETRIRGESKWE